MRRRSLVQRIATEHHSMEDIGYAVETLELARGAIIDSIHHGKIHVGEIIPRFTEAAKVKRLEWLDSARALLDSRKLVYLSSAQKEVALTEGLKREQLRHYEVRIDESVAAQKRLLMRVQDQDDASELLADLAVNFTEKLRQYQTILDNKALNIDLLDAKDAGLEGCGDALPASPDAFSRPRRKRTFYLGGDDDDDISDDSDEEQEDPAESGHGNRRQSIDSQADRASNSIPSLGSLETLPDDNEDDADDNNHHQPPQPQLHHEEEAQADEDEEVFLSFNRRPTHRREDSGFGADDIFSIGTTTSTTNNNTTPFKLTLERPHSPGLFSRLREQFRGLVPFSSPASPPPAHQKNKETMGVGDVVRLYWACERSLPYCVYQVLFFTKPEKRRALANAPSTTESSYGPLHAACRQGHSLIVKILLAFGADPALVSAEGYSPLHYAAESGNLELVSILLATAKEDPAQTARLLEGPLLSKSGYTPLTIAAIRGDLSLAKLLLVRAESLPSPMGQKLGKRLLKTVCTHESLELRGTLLEIATLYGHREMVLFLLNRGAEPLVKEVEYTMAHPSTLPYVTIGFHNR